MIYLGLDLGAVSIKAALLATGADAGGLERLSASSLWHPELLSFALPDGGPARVAVCAYRRTKGHRQDYTRVRVEKITPGTKGSEE